MGSHRLGRGGTIRQQGADKNREGDGGGKRKAGAGAATHADPLALRETVGGAQGYRHQGEKDGGNRRREMGNPGKQMAGGGRTGRKGLQGETAEARVHPEEKREEASTGHTDDDRPREAGAGSTCAGPHNRDDGRPALVRVQEGQKLPRRAGAAFQRAGEEKLGGMGGGRRHKGVLRRNIPRVAYGQHPDGQNHVGGIPEGGILGRGETLPDRARNPAGRDNQPDAGEPCPERTGETSRGHLQRGTCGEGGDASAGKTEGKPRALRGRPNRNGGDKRTRRTREGNRGAIHRGAGSATVGGEDARHEHRGRVRLPGMELPQVQGEAAHKAVQESATERPWENTGDDKPLQGKVAG